MSKRNTVIRSMHDLGIAAWFGGGLMGAVGLNGATAKAKDPTERLRLSSIGWARWTPVLLGAMVVHGTGGIMLIISNRQRLAAQPEAMTNTAVKTVVTGLAGAASLAGAFAGSSIAKHYKEGAAGVTEPDAGSSDQLATAQRIESVTQWLIPIFTGVLIILGAQQGEQQRPAAGWFENLGSRARRAVGR